jgi:TRAP-type C4-dicarboxylate transport system permease small subunit
VSKIQKLPARKAKRNRTILAVVLVVFALLLVIGGVMMYQATVGPVQQQIRDIMVSEQAAAGQTAVRESQLTREAQ